ncbi:MAG: hypothetical protein E7460_03695 [Ruminococcaceae bacterium]|nr:hypothetical protein [Oscillospiraceae bacterium]MBQ8898747.1 hypothetical protein [Clostridia bacterium]
MILQLSDRDFRLLLDMVYSGNWVLNSTREGDRIRQYDKVQRIVFAHCDSAGLGLLCENGCEPSREYVEGGIHEAILDYEDSVFYGILAEELARRDLRDRDVDGADSDLLGARIEEYMAEFTRNGIDNLTLDRGE